MRFVGDDIIDRESAAVVAKLAAGPRVAIIGSTSFWHLESKATCEAIGRLLAALDGLILLTGGVEGAGETVGRSFYNLRSGSDSPRGVYHLLPHGHRSWDYGETLFAGADMEERREVLGRVAECYVVIEGGPGTAHEASVALGRSLCVIPEGRSGGFAQKLYPQVSRPYFASDFAWRQFGQAAASPELVAHAISGIVTAYIRE